MKYKTILLLVILGVLGYFLIQNIPYGQPITDIEQTEYTRIDEKPSVTLVIDTGENISTYSAIPASNVFESLSVFSENENIEIGTKQYDFGVFVESIGEKKSGTDRAWIYSVNGISGEMSADNAKLKTGDLVEWKYTQPMY